MTKEDPLIFVAMRVADLPTPHVPSINWTCHECQAAVWMSKGLIKEAFGADKIVCVQCSLILIEEEKQKSKKT